MTPDQFFGKYDGKGIDFDGYYGFQCLDLYRQFVKEVLEVPQSPPVNGAKDVWNTYLPEYYDRILNTIEAVPIKGDIIIWGVGVGPYGHIAICKDGTQTELTSFDQNWPVGSLCHFQKHNFSNIIGWLRKKTAMANPTPEINDQTLLPIIDENGNKMEVQAVRSRLADQKREIDNLRGLVASLEAEIDELIVKVDECSSSEVDNTYNAIHDVLYGKGFWWTKYKKIKELVPFD